MVKASRARKNRHTRKLRNRKQKGGTRTAKKTKTENKENTSIHASSVAVSFTSKGRRAIVEASSQLRDDIDYLIESKNIPGLQALFETPSPKVIRILKKALKCLKKEEDIGKINDVIENISKDVSKHFDIIKKAFACLNKNELLEE